MSSIDHLVVFAPHISLALLVVVSIAAVRSWVKQNRINDVLIRLETRIDESTKHVDQHTRVVDSLVREIDRALIENTSSLRETLTQGLRELQTQQYQGSHELLTQLITQLEANQRDTSGAISASRESTRDALNGVKEQLHVDFATQRTGFEQRQGDAIKTLQDTLNDGMHRLQMHVVDALARSSADLGKRVDNLTQSTEHRLREISGEVDKRLTEGFEKTTSTFADVLKRLALIDEAQKRITELSSNVVSLQEVLSDKRSRGAFGELQLASLVANVLPQSAYSLQYTFSNGRVADCVLFLPQPTGNMAIDAKFPLESYRRMVDVSLPETERKAAQRQFKLDIRKHIGDIADRYIIQGETTEGAVMFIPAEAVFAEIQAHHPGLVEEAHRARVWMVSPTTLMAVLNTARAVLKDEATRRQVHLIRDHLSVLAADFGRFRKRMDNLARHIQQANRDVEEVHASAGKISSRFERIERVELTQEQTNEIEHTGRK